MIEIKELSKIDELLQGNERVYRHAGLFSVEGEKIISFNADPSKLTEQIEIIKKRITGELSPDGTYIIKLKSNGSKNAPSDELCYMKGKGQALSESPSVPITQTKNVLSFEEAVRLHADIEKYKYEVLRLEDQVKQKDKEIAELKAELEAEPDPEETRTLGDGAPTTILDGFNKLAPTLLAIGNTYFESKNKDRELQKMALLIEKAKINTGGGGGSEQRGAPQDFGEIDLDQEQLDIINALKVMKQTSPEAYKTFLNNFYNAGGSQDGSGN